MGQMAEGWPISTTVSHEKEEAKEERKWGEGWDVIIVIRVLGFGGLGCVWV